MSKYWTIFKISFQQEFVYKLNFVMWRVRNVLSIFLIFFLWDSVFRDPSRVVFGYDRAKILTYVFGLLVIRAVVLASRSIDIAGEISQGNLTNYLLKPVSYFKYWLTRDFASKALNLAFSIGEVGLLFVLLKPDFFLQTDIFRLFLFFVSIVIAIFLFYLLIFLAGLLPLWYPEQPWGMAFLLYIFIDFLGGGVFPLDILPAQVQKILYLTPFPYMLFMPLQIYLEKVDLGAAMLGIAVGTTWIFILGLVMKSVWNIGLKSYRAEGR